MALPSKSRPVEIEEEIQEQLEEERVQPLKMTLSRVKIFHSQMCTWYNGLSKKQRRQVDALHLKRRAVEICHRLHYDYDLLPMDWIPKLKAECGLVIQPSKSERKRQKRAATLVPPPTPNNSEMKFPREVKKKCKERISLQLGAAKTKEEGESMSKLKIPSALELMGRPAHNGKSKTKTFVDLSNDPPPKYWLEAYCRGKVLPRRLSIVSTEDANILYYDYDPKLVDSNGKDIKLEPTDRFNLSALLIDRH